jgi:hypothetical protein
MNLLALVQRFCERTNLPSPNTVYGSTDPQVVQIKALLEEVGIDLNGRGTWQGTTRVATHTTTATEDQGAITTIASDGFKYIKNQTIWDRTDRLPVLGPMDGQEWQALKALFINGPRYRYRLLGGQLLSNPIPPAGHTWAFEYASQNWIVAVDGTTYKQFFTADTDSPVLPETLLLQGLRAWWKKEKGLEYAEDMRMYEAQAKDAMSRDGGKPILHMDGEGWNGPRPGIWVPSGSWPV